MYVYTYYKQDYGSLQSSPEHKDSFWMIIIDYSAQKVTAPLLTYSTNEPNWIDNCVQLDTIRLDNYQPCWI